MPSDDILDLLGRYATGSLTDTERQRLFDAALSDQDLFEELAREQELKMLLEEPGARDRMILALAPPTRRAAWILSAAVTAALSVVLIAFLIHPRPKPPQVAIVTPPLVPVTTVTVPEPAPKPATVPQPVKAKPLTKKSEPPVGQPVVDQPGKDVIEAEKQAVQVQAAAPAIPAAQHFVPMQQSAGGPRQIAQQSRAIALDKKTSFGFHYSVATKGHLVIVPGADGFLYVTTADGTVLFDRKQIAAAITTDIALPDEVSSVSITSSQNASPVKTTPTDRAESTGSVDGQGGLAVKIKVK
jgi:hypothetical protein